MAGSPRAVGGTGIAMAPAPTLLPSALNRDTPCLLGLTGGLLLVLPPTAACCSSWAVEGPAAAAAAVAACACSATCCSACSRACSCCWEETLELSILCMLTPLMRPRRAVLLHVLAMLSFLPKDVGPKGLRWCTGCCSVPGGASVCSKYGCTAAGCPVEAATGTNPWCCSSCCRAWAVRGLAYGSCSS
jgi:hypothetical protein